MSCNDEAERLGVSERCRLEKSKEIKLSCLAFPGHPYSEWQRSGNTNKQARKINTVTTSSIQNRTTLIHNQGTAINHLSQTTYDTNTQVLCLTTCHVGSILIERGKDRITTSFTKSDNVFLVSICNHLQNNASITQKNNTSVLHLWMTQARRFPLGSDFVVTQAEREAQHFDTFWAHYDSTLL